MDGQIGLHTGPGCLTLVDIEMDYRMLFKFVGYRDVTQTPDIHQEWEAAQLSIPYALPQVQVEAHTPIL